MNFFDRFPPPEPEEPGPEPAPPSWFRPDGVLGAGVAAQALLARTEHAVVGVGALTAYPNGFSFTVTVALRRPDRSGRLFHHSLHDDVFGDDGSVSPRVLRLGVEFADGTGASSLGRPFPVNGPDEPDGPVMMRRSGGGNGHRYDMEHWVWPLPPPGPVTFVCAWPAQGIGESRAEVDAALIRDAAGRAISLWPDEPAGSAGR